LAIKPFTAPAQMLFSRTLLPRRRRPAWRKSRIVFDLSRLLSRAYHTTPTGIDRVELAYAMELLTRVPERLRFSAVHPAGGYYGRLELAAVRQFLSFTQARWQTRDIATPADVRAQAIRHLFSLRPRAVPFAEGPRIYLQASPHHLEDEALVSRILETERAGFVCLVHDVIPLTHPEFARPNGAAEHARRMRAIDLYADGIIGNSQATLDAIAPHLTSDRRRISRVAHLGVEWGGVPVRRAAEPVNERPYFLCIATIEPRKNHLLLLNVWRRLVEQLGPEAPRLVLVGRRGWENENVIDVLERSVVLAGHVEEAADVSDRQLDALLAGARAVLIPSFAEGYGMPVAEALAAGVPVIASDLEALREVGGDVPDYLDPIDGLGWLSAVLDYAAPGSPRRAAQLDRMLGWSPVSWSEHIELVLDLVDAVSDLRAER
jgi:glycosyltransferase involved in cell wall biosynthesis